MTRGDFKPNVYSRNKMDILLKTHLLGGWVTCVKGCSPCLHNNELHIDAIQNPEIQNNTLHNTAIHNTPLLNTAQHNTTQELVANDWMSTE